MPYDMDDALPRSARMRKKAVHTTFDAFYRSTWDRTYRTLAVTIRDHDLAKEAVDEAMARAFANWRH